MKNKTLEQHRPEVWKGPKQRKEKNAKQSNIARMFGKDLNKKKTNAKGTKNSIVQRFEKDLKSEKQNDKLSNIARSFGKDLNKKKRSNKIEKQNN